MYIVRRHAIIVSSHHTFSPTHHPPFLCQLWNTLVAAVAVENFAAWYALLWENAFPSSVGTFHTGAICLNAQRVRDWVHIMQEGKRCSVNFVKSWRCQVVAVLSHPVFECRHATSSHYRSMFISIIFKAMPATEQSQVLSQEKCASQRWLKIPIQGC